MSFLDKVTAFLPGGIKEETLEYFFALNIGLEELTAALWIIDGKTLKILSIASEGYASQDEIVTLTDRLLDQVLGLKEIEPQKILFGVPNSWLLDDDLKDEYLKILRQVSKELELAPMAYVATNHAIIHFLENQDSVPTTAILIGFNKEHLTVTVARAGKVDGVKVIKRGEIAGVDIEKALLTFAEVETLPSKILIYGPAAAGLKNELLSFSWMSKLSFLHFPKIDVLDEDIPIRSICLAGGSEINSAVKLTEEPIKKSPVKSTLADKTNFGFVVGDVAEESQKSLRRQSYGASATKVKSQNGLTQEELETEKTEEKEEAIQERELVIPEESAEIGDFEEMAQPALPTGVEHKKKFNFKRLIPKNVTVLLIIFGILGVIVLLAAAFFLWVKADVKIYVEPKILEKEATVVADPNQKTVDEGSKIIPGQIIETEVSGTAKDNATGKKTIGDPAKGTVVIRNKTDSAITLSKGTSLLGSNQKFILDVSVTIASRSADDGTWGKANGEVTAVNIGADGNLPSGIDMTASNYSIDKIIAKTEGNFSGGTSKDVTVVSSEDQQRLLAKLSSDLRQQAQQKLQDKYLDKKILAEALSENIISKNYNKNINDAASEFSLNLTVKFKGTAFDDADLRTIVSKLVNTQVPDGFELDLSQTETQADVSELKKDGKLIFLARFKAKLLPKIDSDKIKSQIRFKTADQVDSILKGMDNVLGSDIKMTPNLPKIFQRMPILPKNITIEVGLK